MVAKLLGPTMRPPFKVQLLDPRAVPEAAATEGSCDLPDAELVRSDQASTWHATNLGKWLEQQHAKKGDSCGFGYDEGEEQQQQLAAQVAQLSTMIANYEATCKDLDMKVQLAIMVLSWATWVSATVAAARA
ncbi:hypothetical protein PLESTM_000924000 [Pleodorina starrii]|nr:hypothetical protein PLESTM_000924000 [Pleodorina starrii]